MHMFYLFTKVVIILQLRRLNEINCVYLRYGEQTRCEQILSFKN